MMCDIEGCDIKGKWKVNKLFHATFGLPDVKTICGHHLYHFNKIRRGIANV